MFFNIKMEELKSCDLIRSIDYNLENIKEILFYYKHSDDDEKDDLKQDMGHSMRRIEYLLQELIKIYLDMLKH